MTDEELFRVQHVRVQIPEENMPGRPLKRVQCVRCLDWVQDKRDLQIKGENLCKQCVEGRYYIESLPD